MRKASSVQDIPYAYRDNMEVAAECKIRLEGLIDAVKDRQ